MQEIPYLDIIKNALSAINNMKNKINPWIKRKDIASNSHNCMFALCNFMEPKVEHK